MNSPALTRKLPARLAPVAFSFYMSAIMAFVMCLVLTAVGSGLGEGYAQRVLHTYAIAWPVAFLCVLAVRPVVLFLVRCTVQAPGP